MHIVYMLYFALSVAQEPGVQGDTCPYFFGGKKVVKDGILAWSQTLSLNQEVKGYI